MHYLPFGTRLNKCILMVTQLILGFSAHLNQRELLPLHCSGGFGGYVIDYAVDVLNFVGDSV